MSALSGGSGAGSRVIEVFAQQPQAVADGRSFRLYRHLAGTSDISLESLCLAVARYVMDMSTKGTLRSSAGLPNFVQSVRRAARLRSIPWISSEQQLLLSSIVNMVRRAAPARARAPVAPLITDADILRLEQHVTRTCDDASPSFCLLVMVKLASRVGLRVVEMVDLNLCPADITFLSSGIRVRRRFSKTNKMSEEPQYALASTTDSGIAIDTLLHRFAARRFAARGISWTSDSVPLFTFECAASETQRLRPWKRGTWVHRVRSLLQAAGVTCASTFKGHDLRRLALTSMMAAAAASRTESEHVRKAIGMHSNSFRLYDRRTDEDMMDVLEPVAAARAGLARSSTVTQSTA